MVRDYLIALKNKGNFTAADVAKMSGIPEATIRKILTGETPDPRFETVAKLVTAMGGSLDDAFSTNKEKAIEANVVTELKTGFDIRVESLRERIDEYRERLEKSDREKKVLAIVVAALMTIIVALLVFDIAIGSHGWVQY